VQSSAAQLASGSLGDRDTAQAPTLAQANRPSIDERVVAKMMAPLQARRQIGGGGGEGGAGGGRGVTKATVQAMDVKAVLRNGVSKRGSKAKARRGARARGAPGAAAAPKPD
jgi:hypothetical protein